MTRQEKSTLRLCQLREPRDARRLLTKLVGEITAGPERLSGVAGARGGAAEPSRTQTLLSASRKTFAHIGKTPHTHRASRLSPQKAARPRSAASSERGPALRCEPNCAVLCYSMLCRAMLCYSTPCCAVLCPAITCRTVPCHSAMPRRTTRRCTARSVPYRTVRCHTIPCGAVRCRPPGRASRGAAAAHAARSRSRPWTICCAVGFASITSASQ